MTAPANPTTPRLTTGPIDRDDRQAEDETADLLRRAEQAAHRRAYATDPAVIALAVDEVRVVVERTMWIGIVLGMLFTTANVQQATSRGAAMWSIAWCTAWLLAPLVEVPLLAALRAEQIAGRYGIAPTPLVRRARWSLLAAGYLLNTWGAWATVFGSMGKTNSPLGAGWDVVLWHSIPPLAVLVAVEMLTDLREMFTHAIEKAASAPRVERARPPAARVNTRTVPPRPRPRPPAAGSADNDESTDPPPPADQRTAREIAVAWALDHWGGDHRDAKGQPCEIRPMHVSAAMFALGKPISKGEASKALKAARGQRAADGLDIGSDVEPGDTAEEEIG